MWVSVLTVTPTAAGSITCRPVASTVQRCLSVTTTEYVPGGRLLTSFVVAVLDHAYTKGPVPPFTVSAIAPSVEPAHFTPAPWYSVITGTSASLPGCGRGRSKVLKHPLISVIVTKYVPSPLPLISSVVSPDDHRNVSVPVPPPGVRFSA